MYILRPMTKTATNNLIFNLTKGEIMMKSLLKISTMLLISGFIFADGAYDSYDIPSFEYKTLQINGNDLLDFHSQGDVTSMSVDVGAAYNFMSQSAGANCSYGGSFDFDMDDTGVEGEDATSNFDIGLNGSMEKYLVGGNKGLFAYGDADFSMMGGTQAEDVDDTMDLWLDIGAGYGRVVNARPVAQAYAIADALGDTSDETVMAIAAVIGAAGSYSSIHKDDAMEAYYNDIAAAAGDPTAAMKVMKIMTSPAYNITDRATGYSVSAGLVNNYMQCEDCEDSGDLNIGAEYAMPIGMDMQLMTSFDYGMGMNEFDTATMELAAGFSMAHSYNWATTASFTYANSTTTGDGIDDVTTSGVVLGVSSTKAILNTCSVTGGFGYVMDLEDDGADPIMDLDVTFTYWVF